MRSGLIKKSFQATGVWPMDADAVLKRFNNRTLRQAKASQLGQYGDGDSWRELRRILDVAVSDKAKVEARQLKASLHSLQVQNELLHHENQGLQQALNAREKRTNNSKTMDLQQREEYYGRGVFWSPRKVRDGRAHEAVKRQEAEREQLQKTHDRELKGAARLYKKKQAEAAKVARQEAAEERRKAKAARAEELATARALKKQQRDAATSRKSHDTGSKAKRKASHSAAQNPTKRRRVVGAASRAEAEPPPASPRRKFTRTRSVRPPSKYSK
jgi:hypothetical protein